MKATEGTNGVSLTKNGVISTKCIHCPSTAFYGTYEAQHKKKYLLHITKAKISFRNRAVYVGSVLSTYKINVNRRMYR